MLTKENPAEELVVSLTRAFNHFNRELFEGALPPVMVLMHRHQGARSYFSPRRWSKPPCEEGGEPTFYHELAVNPDHLKGRETREILSTLVHEQCHHWQQEFGTPSKNFKNHNPEWGKKMESIGLMPSSTGAEGGKKTGHKMSHYIVDGGPFDQVCSDLLKTGFNFPYLGESNGAGGGSEKKPKKASTRATLVCPGCEIKASVASLEVKLTCTECQVEMIDKDEL